MHRKCDIKLFRCAALVLSAITLVSSIGIIGFGLRTYVELGFTTPLLGINLVNYGAFLQLFVGIATFALTPLGLYSIIINHSTLMVMYMMMIFFVGCLSVVGGTLGWTLDFYVQNEESRAWLESSMMHEYGHPHGLEVTDAWDRMQRQFRCCGVSNGGTKLWLKTAWYDNQERFPHARVPSSCCATCATVHERFCTAFFLSPEMGRDLQIDQDICLKASELCEAADERLANERMCLGHAGVDRGWPAEAYVHTKGCADALFEQVRFYSSRMLVSGFVFALFLFTNVFVWFLLHYAIENVSYHTVTVGKL